MSSTSSSQQLKVVVYPLESFSSAVGKFSQLHPELLSKGDRKAIMDYTNTDRKKWFCLDFNPITVGTPNGNVVKPEIRSGLSGKSATNVELKDPHLLPQYIEQMFPPELPEKMKHFQTFWQEMRGKSLYPSDSFLGREETRIHKFLYYTKGDHFEWHTDNKRDETGERNLATVLFFEPSPGLSGGDLVLKADPNTVKDPKNILESNGDLHVLKVDELTGPVFVAFNVDVPHMVTRVEKGHRFAYKSTVTLPISHEHFSFPHSEEKDFKMLRTMRVNREIQNTLKEMQELQEKLSKLNAKLVDLSPENVDNISVEETLKNVAASAKPCIVAVKTSPPEDFDTYTPEDKILAVLTDSEMELYRRLSKKYSVKCRILEGFQSFDREVCSDEVDELMKGPRSTASIEFLDFKQIPVTFFQFASTSTSYSEYGYYNDYGRRYNCSCEYNDYNYDYHGDDIHVVCFLVK